MLLTSLCGYGKQQLIWDADTDGLDGN